MAGGGSPLKAIPYAFLANLGIAIAKLVGFFVTGSSSMLAETIHSFGSV
jgi:divalent metal cation (Fe/Co/Zn/Cd) transporter